MRKHFRLTINKQPLPQRRNGHSVISEFGRYCCKSRGRPLNAQLSNPIDMPEDSIFRFSPRVLTQCCVLESKKSFCNKIGPMLTKPLTWNAFPLVPPGNVCNRPDSPY
jgi:hypothetical protein